LGGGGDVFLDREVSEKLRDLLLAHLLGMAFAVEEDVAPDPIDVDLFGADRVVLEAKVPAHAVEQFGFGRSEGRGWHLSPMILLNLATNSKLEFPISAARIVLLDCQSCDSCSSSSFVLVSFCSRDTRTRTTTRTNFGTAREDR